MNTDSALQSPARATSRTTHGRPGCAVVGSDGRDNGVAIAFLVDSAPTANRQDPIEV
ncbi:hypothetical protein [Reticulibacter mediterranei]|uniref:hypothetical protein n=1 Tax=Reticulibacter mediterranei TaxID=2778369 RepID=UPI001C68D253|nr:hypothetical protein [Reticulibacter mediterranei]